MGFAGEVLFAPGETAGNELAPHEEAGRGIRDAVGARAAMRLLYRNMPFRPVLVGSLGRILAGALTDRFGGRLMFTVLLLATAPFVVLVGYAGKEDSYGLMLLFGFFLGIGGTTFAVGIPFVNAWFPPERRGLPLLVSVGRLNRVKGMAPLVRTWAESALANAANLLVVGGDLAAPSEEEREQLAAMRSATPICAAIASSRAASGEAWPGRSDSASAIRSPIGSISDASDRPAWVLKTFVESQVSTFTPPCLFRSPSALSAAGSNGSPTSGVGSALKSAEWKMRPAGVSMTSAELSGIECAIGMKPTVNGPAWTTCGQAST